MGMGLVEVTSVSPAGRWKLHLTFSDGFSGTADLRWLVDRGGVFEPLQDPAYFAKVSVDTELGTVVWPNDADIAPETLRQRAEAEPSVMLASPSIRQATPSARKRRSSSLGQSLLRALGRMLGSRSHHPLR
jgi:hypothetical protein